MGDLITKPMIDFWNSRYAEPEFVYGTQPNVFFRETIDTLPVGKLLLPAEGEGRNAVYAAQLGWDATAFDFSAEGRNKALQLAEQRGVTIEYTTQSSLDFNPVAREYDAIGLFYTHLPAPLRADLFPKLIRTLKPAGYVTLEGFHKNQPRYTSGGPKDETMLFSVEELQQAFGELTITLLEDRIVELNEGSHHKGTAHVVRMIAFKK